MGGRGPELFSRLGRVLPGGHRTACEAPETLLSLMAFSKPSRPPGRQMPRQGCKPSQRRRAWSLPRWSLPRCLRELPPHIPSTSFQSRLLLTSFSWRDNSKKQGMFFFKESCFPMLWLGFLRMLWISGPQGSGYQWWPPCGNLALPSLAGSSPVWRVLGMQACDLQMRV